MVTLPRKFHTSTVPLRALGIVVVSLVLGMGGCAQRTYRATSLPTEFRAPPTEDIAEISISQLSSFAVNSQLIDCGDVLEVTIRTDLSEHALPVRVRVGDDGTADIPPVGQVALAGLELEGAELSIASIGVSNQVFQRPPYVTVLMYRRRTNSITVFGAVEKEGIVELPRGSSCLLNAIVAAGGLTEDAGQDVEIRRPAGRSRAPGRMRPPRDRVAGGSGAELTAYVAPEPAAPTPKVVRVNLAKAAAEGNGGHYLEDGDVVMVSKRVPKPIYVMGLVRKPGEQELSASKDMYLLEAIAKAGGRTMQVADKVYITRQAPGQEKSIVIQASIREAKMNGLANVRLAPGDIVSVEETPATVVLDALKSFIRFGFSSSIPLL